MKTNSLLEIPCVKGLSPFEMPPPDATLGEIERALAGIGLTDLLELRVPLDDVQVQHPARKLTEEEMKVPLMHLSDNILRLVAGQVPGDRVDDGGTRLALPRLVGLSHVQVWSAEGDESYPVQPGPVQMSLIPDIEYELVRGQPPRLVTTCNLRVLEKSAEKVWSFEGCFSEKPQGAYKENGGDIYTMVQHPRWVRYEYWDLDARRHEERAEDDGHVGPVLHEERHNREGVRPGQLVSRNRRYYVPPGQNHLLDHLRDITDNPALMAGREAPEVPLPELTQERYQYLTGTGQFAGRALDRRARWVEG